MDDRQLIRVSALGTAVALPLLDAAAFFLVPREAFAPCDRLEMLPLPGTTTKSPETMTFTAKENIPSLPGSPLRLLPSSTSDPRLPLSQLSAAPRAG
jgi:hypothetical protein